MSLEIFIVIIGAIFLIIGFIFTLKTYDRNYLYISIYDIFLLFIGYEVVLKNYLSEVISFSKALTFIIFSILMLCFLLLSKYLEDLTKEKNKKNLRIKMQLVKLIIISTILFLIPFIFIRHFLLFPLVAFIVWAFVFSFVRDETRQILKNQKKRS